MSLLLLYRPSEPGAVQPRPGDIVFILRRPGFDRVRTRAATAKVMARPGFQRVFTKERA